MPSVKCSKCNGSHARPVGRKCTRPVVEADNITASTEGESSNVGTSTGPATASLPLQAPPPNDVLTMFADFQQQLLTQMSSLVKSEVERAVQSQPSVSASATQSATVLSPLLATSPAETPTVSSLRSDNNIQAAVSQRLQAMEQATTNNFGTNGNELLANNVKIKSGRERLRGQDIKRSYVAWPHEFITVGPSCASVKYDDLDQAQFSAGLLSFISSEKDHACQQIKIKYVTQLHHDMCEVGFKTVHACNAMILSRLEEQSLSWEHYDELDRVREKFIFSSLAAASLKSTNQAKSRPEIKNIQNHATEKICSAFNLGKCDQYRHHSDANGLQVKHFCSYCYTLGQRWPHTEVTCRKRTVRPPYQN